jgi:hypothetical protein
MTEAQPEVTEDSFARMADDLERIAAHLVPFLKASYNETQERLKRAERVIASRQERPAIVGMHQLLGELRRLEPGAEVHEFVEESLVRLLSGLGYKEFGRVGDPYDPNRHEPVGGQTERGEGKVSRVRRRGLVCYGDVVVRAVVEVEPSRSPDRSASPTMSAPRGTAAPDRTGEADEAFPMPADDVVAPSAGPFDHAQEGA